MDCGGTQNFAVDEGGCQPSMFKCIADRHGRWLELSVFHIMLPVYVLPEHFPSKARKTTNICNNPNKHSFDGTKKEGRTFNEMLPMIVKSAKVFDSLSNGSTASLDQPGIFGTELLFVCRTKPLLSERVAEALNINPSVKVVRFSSVCMFVETLTDYAGDDEEHRGHLE